jgi:hypothetical protein
MHINVQHRLQKSQRLIKEKAVAAIFFMGPSAITRMEVIPDFYNQTLKKLSRFYRLWRIIRKLKFSPGKIIWYGIMD